MTLDDLKGRMLLLISTIKRLDEQNQDLQKANNRLTFVGVTLTAVTLLGSWQAIKTTLKDPLFLILAGIICLVALAFFIHKKR